MIKHDKCLFPDLNPGGRIHRIIETYIFPDLEKIGFKMSKSSLTIKRKVGDFEQEIYFAKNKRNQGNELVSFDPHLSVKSKAYVKWHKNKYGTEPMNEYILRTRAHYIPNWNHTYFESWWYDLVEHDNNDIVKALNDNINKNGLPYLNTLSDRQSTINFIMGQNSYYYKAPMLFDFAFMLNDKMQAENILTWFNDYKIAADSNFQTDTLRDVAIRQEVLNNWV